MRWGYEELSLIFLDSFRSNIATSTVDQCEVVHMSDMCSCLSLVVALGSVRPVRVHRCQNIYREMAISLNRTLFWTEINAFDV